jgi:hypothetical protein
MKKMFLAFLLLDWYACQAQTINVTISEKFSLRDRGMTEKDGATQRRGDFFYCMETDYKSMQFAYTAKLDKIKYGINMYKYDGNMKQVQQVGLQGGDKSYGPFPPRMTQFGGKMLIFYYQAMDNGAIQLLYSTVDPESLNISAGKQLYTISEKNVGLFKLEKAVFGNKLLFCLSPDGSKLLVSQSGNTSEMFACVINADLSIEKPVASKVNANMEDFAVERVLLDEAGNRYFAYSFLEDKADKHGVFVQNVAGKVGFLSFRANADGVEAGRLGFQLSKDQQKVFVYGPSSSEHLEEGVILATVDATGMKLGKPQLCPFPAELKERLKKMDYTEKHRDHLIVKDIFYHSNVLDDGTVVLTGFPIDRETSILPSATITNSYGGPILNIFIKDEKFALGVIYRNQQWTQASSPVTIPYGDKLVCIYTDSEKGIASDDAHTNDKVKHEDDLVLAMAVLNSDGTIVSKKKLADRAGGANFFTLYTQQSTASQYLIPLGKNKTNLARYYTELEAWATLDIAP